MAEGIVSVAPSVDFVFCGDGEVSFPRFLRRVKEDDVPRDRIIIGESCTDLDAIPTLDYSEYFDQLEEIAPDFPRDDIWLPYETSRGCWWGQHRRCTFCGLNSLDATFRASSPSRVNRDLTEIEKRYPTRRVAMADNVMPKTVFDSLIPQLVGRRSGLRFFFELRAGLSLAHMRSLAQAGVTTVQFGIEALSPTLLKRLDKGTTPSQNIASLRYGRALRIAVLWNLLYEVPGDTVEEYELTAELLPLISHLAPPYALIAVSIDRFSRYHERPEGFGIDNLRPFEEYAEVYPEDAEIEKLAYYFDGDYSSGSRDHPEIIELVDREIEATRARWMAPAGPPVLHVSRLGETTFVLRDTRGVAPGKENRLVTADQAMAALAGGPAVPTAAIEWAIEHRAAVRIGHRWVPLATADADLLSYFEERSQDAVRPVASASA
jgi:ribosomal peptide maturation radical SAM protein 1